MEAQELNKFQRDVRESIVVNMEGKKEYSGGGFQGREQSEIIFELNNFVL